MTNQWLSLRSIRLEALPAWRFDLWCLCSRPSFRWSIVSRSCSIYCELMILATSPTHARRTGCPPPLRPKTRSLPVSAVLAPTSPAWPALVRPLRLCRPLWVDWPWVPLLMLGPGTEQLLLTRLSSARRPASNPATGRAGQLARSIPLAGRLVAQIAAISTDLITRVHD
jgi:hypothetical protein